MLRWRSLFLLLPLVAARPLVAQGASEAGAAPRDPVRPAPWVTRGDLAILGAGALASWLAHQADLDARRAVRAPGPQGSATLDALAATGNFWGGAGAVGTGVALWGGGLAADDRTVAATGLRALEAITVSGVITKGLKAAFGRARPRVDSLDAWNVEFGRGWDNDHEAFPSGHSTAAFAFAAAVTSEVARRAPERARAVGAATFTLGVVTAYARMHSDAHWLSDVTMGAAIGMASGWAVTRWHATRPGNAVDRLLLDRTLTPIVMTGAQGRTILGASVAWR